MFKRICIIFLHKCTKFKYFCFFSLKRYYIGFFENTYLFVYAVYPIEHVPHRLGGDSPHIDKNGVFVEGSPYSESRRMFL